MEIDIATLLENHRRHMLTSAREHVEPNEFDDVAGAIARDHDRATTKALLDLYRTSQGTGQPATATNTVTIATASRKVKAGSKKARDRAIKAGETRRNNLAAKHAAEANAGSFHGTATIDDKDAPPMDNVKLVGEGSVA